MADLQRRLTVLGYPVGSADGVFSLAVADAVAQFQGARGLRPDGVCGEQTWAALVEAGYRIGDRRLYLRKPMMRGDDVAELQRRLGSLGFDTGKVDGIFGPDTAAALADFQRNAGLSVDGICGPDELRVLHRLGRGGGDGVVTEIRELEALRRPTALQRLRVAVGEQGGVGALAAATANGLRQRGAEVVTLSHPDGSELAQQANGVRAELFVELRSSGTTPGCRCAYYQGYRTTSPAGQRLAALVQSVVPAALDAPDDGCRGMAIPVLRETRMPAVVCELGPASHLVTRSAEVADALVEAITAWVSPAAAASGHFSG